jgi:hypothetical protein
MEEEAGKMEVRVERSADEATLQASERSGNRSAYVEVMVKYEKGEY